jgi:hypothetical protein
MPSPKRVAGKQAFDFVLVLSAPDELTDRLADSLFEAGCDDGTLGERDRTLFIAFTREADSLVQAVYSAILDVEQAGIGASVAKVEVEGRDRGKAARALNAFLELRKLFPDVPQIVPVLKKEIARPTRDKAKARR